MAKQIDFSNGTIVTPEFLDSMQEVISALALGVRIREASATQYELPVAGDGSATGQSSLVINGQQRWWTSPIVKSITPGGAGTYSVYATAGAGPTPTITHAIGAGPANSRKLGEVDWDGAAITDVRNTIPVSAHAYEHRPSGTDPLDTAAAVQLTPTTPNAEGTSQAFARADHTHDLPTAAGTTLTDASANAEGSSGSFARADHKHDLDFAGGLAVGTSLTLAGDAVLTVASAAGGDLSGVFGNLQLVNNSVGQNELAGSAVTNAKVAAGAAIARSKLDFGLGLVAGDLADGAVTTVKLADLGVTTAKIADLGVTTPKLADLAVTNAKLAGGIANGKLATDPLARANHTGTQLASTISNFGAAGDALWIGEGQGAGGALAGSYPNPAIAAGAVGRAALSAGLIQTARVAYALDVNGADAVVIVWAAPFPDVDYTVALTIEAAAGAADEYPSAVITPGDQLATQITAQIKGSPTFGGVLHAIAIHD